MRSHKVTPVCPLPNPETSAREVLAHLQGAGIPYCLLRPQADWDSQSGDLDVLIEESSVEQCRRVLEALGFVRGPGRSPFKLVMLRYRHGRLLCLDIHWKAVQYGVIYMDASRMLARRIETDGAFRLSAEDELIHLVAHNLLRKGPLRSASLQRIREILATPLDRRYLDDHLDAFGLRPSFEAAVTWIARDEGHSPKAAELRRRFLLAALCARPGNAFRYLKLRLHLGRAAGRRGGLVALVGPDGSGKSTVVRTLLERARAIPSLKIQTTYLGPWGQMKLSLVPTLRRFGMTPAVRPLGPQLATGSTRQTASIRGRLGSAAKGHLFYVAMYIELVYRYVSTVFFRVRKGNWVIADRYITDLRYLYKERPISNYGAIRRLLCAIYPKPDLFIVLDNSPEVIVSRKSGLAAAQIETLRHFLLKAARSYRFEVVTTDRPPEEIADHILNRMLALRAGK